MSFSDGQRFPVPVRWINATTLPRYFNRGRRVEMCTWTSDQYSHNGFTIVPATVRDATYVLDELLQWSRRIDQNFVANGNVSSC